MSLKNTRPEGTYVSILSSDGSFRVKSNEDNIKAVRRDYETSDGTKGTKYELVFNELDGKIIGISFRDGEFGRVLNIVMVDGDERFIISVNTASNFGTDFMKKLPNINLEEVVVLAPYSFDDKKGKKQRGISIIQNGEKIQSAYYDKEKKEEINGFPKVDTKKKPEKTAVTKWKKFWNAYFSEVEEFLVEKTEEIIKTLPEYEEEIKEDFSFSKLSGKKTYNKAIEYPEDDIDPNDIPF